jgi:hypothetical protein
MKSIKEMKDACDQIKQAAKPVAESSQDAMGFIGTKTGELEQIVAGNSRSGPKAVHALRDAAMALGRVRTAVDSMNRAIDGFVSDEESR